MEVSPVNQYRFPRTDIGSSYSENTRCMDYDSAGIAQNYDSGRSYTPEVLGQWLDLFSTHLPRGRIDTIIDLGCGTGRYSGALAAHFAANVVGIDPSKSMLDQARVKNASRRVSYQRGSGENLPVAIGSADLVFMSMVLHHLTGLRQTALECRRVLHQEGWVCIRNSTADAINSFPYVQFFPGIRALIEEQLPSRNHVVAQFEEAGFQVAAHEIVSHSLAPDWYGYADKMARRVDSFLVRLTDEAFKTGILALRSHAKDAGSTGPVLEDVDLFVFEK